MHYLHTKLTKIVHDIIIGIYQLTKSSHYTHDVKEQDSACPLTQQYPFAKTIESNGSLVFVIGFKQYAF